MNKLFLIILTFFMTNNCLADVSEADENSKAKAIKLKEEIQHQRQVTANLIVLNSLNIHEFMEEESKCIRVVKKTPRCSAFFQVIPKKIAEYKNYISGLSFVDLEIKKDDICKKQKSSSTSCRLLLETFKYEKNKAAKGDIALLDLEGFLIAWDDCKRPYSEKCDLLKKGSKKKAESYYTFLVDQDKEGTYKKMQNVCSEKKGLLCRTLKKVGKVILKSKIKDYEMNTVLMNVDDFKCKESISYFKKNGRKEDKRAMENSLKCKASKKAIRIVKSKIRRGAE